MGRIASSGRAGGLPSYGKAEVKSSVAKAAQVALSELLKLQTRAFLYDKMAPFNDPLPFLCFLCL